MAPRKPALYAQFSGPFFTSDPTKTFRGNARSMLRQIALEGERIIAAELRSGEVGRSPIHARTVSPVRVSGHVTAGIPFTPVGGKAARRGNINVNVYVPNFGYTPKEARSLMAAYSRVEAETHAFRRTANALRRSRAVNVAELLRDIA